MGGKRTVIREAAIVLSDGAAALDRYVPDLANWPGSWSIEPADLPIGQRIVAFLRPFLIDLLTQQLADKTLRRHRDHLWMLGSEIVRRRYEAPQLAKPPVETVLLEFIEEDGGPLIWPRITEDAQKAFDVTCRKLHHFIHDRQTL